MRKLFAAILGIAVGTLVMVAPAEAGVRKADYATSIRPLMPRKYYKYTCIPRRDDPPQCWGPLIPRK